MQRSKPCFRCGTAFCRHRKSGLPSNPPNHKSDGGSLQSWNRPSPQLPATGQMNDGSFRFRRRRYQVIATNFAGASPWRGKRLREENGRDCPAPALYEQTSWSGFPGLWSKRFCWLRWLQAQSWKGPQQTAPLWLRAAPPWRSGSGRRTFNCPAPMFIHTHSGGLCPASCG